MQEAAEAGRVLRSEGYVFDVAFTSVLKRAIKTLWLALEEMDLMWIPVYNSWRLNERHYGSLQGLNKVAMVDRFGAQQVQLWRRSYDIPPPALEPGDERSPAKDPSYAGLDAKDIPLAECLKDTVARVLPRPPPPKNSSKILPKMSPISPVNPCPAAWVPGATPY